MGTPTTPSDEVREEGEDDGVKEEEEEEEDKCRSNDDDEGIASVVGTIFVDVAHLGYDAETTLRHLALRPRAAKFRTVIRTLPRQ